MFYWVINIRKVALLIYIYSFFFCKIVKNVEIKQFTPIINIGKAIQGKLPVKAPSINDDINIKNTKLNPILIDQNNVFSILNRIIY